MEKLKEKAKVAFDSFRVVVDNSILLKMIKLKYGYEIVVKLSKSQKISTWFELSVKIDSHSFLNVDSFEEDITSILGSETIKTYIQKAEKDAKDSAELFVLLRDVRSHFGILKYFDEQHFEYHLEHEGWFKKFVDEITIVSNGFSFTLNLHDILLQVTAPDGTKLVGNPSFLPMYADILIFISEYIDKKKSSKIEDKKKSLETELKAIDRIVSIMLCKANSSN